VVKVAVWGILSFDNIPISRDQNGQVTETSGLGAPEHMPESDLIDNGSFNVSLLSSKLMISVNSGVSGARSPCRFSQPPSTYTSLTRRTHYTLSFKV
jgi:hypothetical protein